MSQTPDPCVPGTLATWQFIPVHPTTLRVWCAPSSVPGFTDKETEAKHSSKTLEGPGTGTDWNRGPFPVLAYLGVIFPKPFSANSVCISPMLSTRDEVTQTSWLCRGYPHPRGDWCCERKGPVSSSCPGILRGGRHHVKLRPWPLALERAQELPH